MDKSLCHLVCECSVQVSQVTQQCCRGRERERGGWGGGVVRGRGSEEVRKVRGEGI